MKKLLIISWAVFFLGLIFKLLHFPFSGILMILGCLLLFIHSIIFLIKNSKTNLPSSLLYLSFSLWTIHLLFRILYWPGFGQPIFGLSTIFVIPSIATVIWLVIHIIKHAKFKIPQIILGVYFLLSIVLSYTHSDRIYYFFNLNPLINQDVRANDFLVWDKYSWFLYIADKPDEALEANKNAQKIVEGYLQNNEDKELKYYSNLIKQHEQQIRKNNWTTYP